MKKLLSIILTVIILCGVLAVPAFAKDISGWSGTITVNGEECTYIKNEFYQIYHDKLFEENYTIYSDGVKNGITEIYSSDSGLTEIRTVPFENIGKINKALYEEINSSEDTYYLSVYLDYTENFSEAKNTELLNSAEGIDDILYIGSTTPCAVIAVTGNNIDKVLEYEHIQYVNYAFFVFSQTITSQIPENGNRTYAPDAAHARKVLRYAGGLYDLSDMTYLSQIKEFLIMSDADFNGKITAADARAALRIAAGLDEKTEFIHSSDSFWNSN